MPRFPVDFDWNLLSTRPRVGHTQVPLNAGPTVACGFGGGLYTGLGAGVAAGLDTGFGTGFDPGAATGLDDTTALLRGSGAVLAPLEPAAGLTRNRWPL